MKKIKKPGKILRSPKTDPLGSYTGVVTLPDGEECEDWATPVQDADDL